MRAGEVALHRVRMRCSEETEPLQARLRLEYLLSTADFQPGGLPPSAILLLRRLRAPRPLALSGVRVGTGWEQALRYEIDRQARQAMRPVRGRVPAGADAVLFIDIAELLACLGVLTLFPEPERLWIWQAAPGGRASVPERESLTRRWQEAPRFLPAALRHLEAWGEAVSVLQMLTERHAEALCAAIAREFGLFLPTADRWQAPLGESQLEERREDSASSLAAADGMHPAGESQLILSAGLPAWLPERLLAWQALPPITQRLLTLAHVTTRAVSQAECAVAWKAVQAMRPAAFEPKKATPVAERAPRRFLHFESDLVPEASRQETKTVVEERSEEAAVLPDVSLTAAETLVADMAVSERELAQTGITGEKHVSATDALPTEFEGTADAEQRPLWDGLTGIPTRFAGIFYLLNLLNRLDAPGCFDAEFALSAHLTAWGLMEGFGRSLLEETDQETAGDALWRLLAQLDGREPGIPLAPGLPDRERRLAQVYAHLRSALESVLGDASLRDLLSVRGTLYVTRIHVDLVMALDAIWLPARRAGTGFQSGLAPGTAARDLVPLCLRGRKETVLCIPSL